MTGSGGPDLFDDLPAPTGQSGLRVRPSATIDAVPTTAGTTGVRYFATDQTGLIKMSMAAITTANFDAAAHLQ